MQKGHSRCAEGCAEGMSAKRSFKVHGGGAQRGARTGCVEGLSAKRSFKVHRGVRGGVHRGGTGRGVQRGCAEGVHGGSECKKVIQGARRGVRRV